MEIWGSGEGRRGGEGGGGGECGDNDVGDDNENLLENWLTLMDGKFTW